MRRARPAGSGFSPLDDELRLLPGRLSPRLREVLARLGTWMPFGRAAEALGWVARTAVSEATASRVTEAAGAAYVAEQTAEVERLEQRPAPASAGPALQQLSADGAMLSLVGGQWVEVKTLAIGTVVQEHDGEVGARELSYFSRQTDHATFRRLAQVETHRRGVGTAGVVVAVMDGAEWLQGFVDVHLHDAVRVLDFPHAVAYLTRARHDAFGPGTAATSQWLGQPAHTLKHIGPEPVMAAPRALPVGEHRDEALGYLARRLPELQYPTFRAAGYPIGSGIVEGANTVVVEARLKGSGRHWAPQHVDSLLALRTIVCADRWEEAWPRISARLRAEDRARRRRRQARRRGRPAVPSPPPAASSTPPPNPVPAPPTAHKVVVNGRPTKPHPWNRRFLPARHPATAKL